MCGQQRAHYGVHAHYSAMQSAMSLFQRAQDGATLAFYTRHGVVETMVKIAVEAREDGVVSEAAAVLRHLPDDVVPLLQECDPGMSAFKRILAVHTYYPRMSIYFLKRKLSKSALVPLREDLERIGKSSSYDDDVRTAARELVVGIKYAGASASSSAAGRVL